MILIFLGVVLFFSLSITFLLHLRNRKLTKQITAITNELQVNRNNNAAPLLYFTEYTEIQRLLVEINRIIDQNRAIYKKEKAQNETMKRMLTNISHDLRTPMTVILGYIEVLKREMTTLDKQDAEKKLSKMENQATKLLNTLHYFFDLAKLQAGEMKLENELLDISELLRAELVTYFDFIEQEKWCLDLEISEKPTLVYGDRKAMRRIFTNLLSNALKYGGQGKYLSIKAWQKEKKTFIAITDHGKGIKEENQSKIFERLFTLDDAKSRDYQGSGLGLAITKQLVQAMNGEISLYSKPYNRTTFMLIFPNATEK